MGSDPGPHPVDLGGEVVHTRVPVGEGPSVERLHIAGHQDPFVGQGGDLAVAPGDEGGHRGPIVGSGGPFHQVLQGHASFHQPGRPVVEGGQLVEIGDAPLVVEAAAAQVHALQEAQVGRFLQDGIAPDAQPHSPQAGTRMGRATSGTVGSRRWPRAASTTASR